MSDLRTVAQQALRAMEKAVNVMEVHLDVYFEAMSALRAALREQPAPEPVASAVVYGLCMRGHRPDLCGTNPPQRRPLTDEEIHECFQQRSRDKATERRLITRAIERAHGIGGEE